MLLLPLPGYAALLSVSAIVLLQLLHEDATAYFLSSASVSHYVCVCLSVHVYVCVWFVAVRSCGGDCGKRQTAAVAAARTSFERTPLGRVVTSIAISLVHAHLPAIREISCLCLARSRSLTL